MYGLKNMKSKKILVIGDVMLDIYYKGEVKRISPEAPVPVFCKKNERCVLGGAANVAANLIAANQKVAMMSVVGNDMNGCKLVDMLEKNKINTDLMTCFERKTTEKIRIIAENNQQILRLDMEDAFEISKSESMELLEKLRNKIEEFDLIVISDYLKGLLSYEFTQGVIRLANKLNIPTLIDVKDTKIEKYSNAFLVKPNLNELSNLTGERPKTYDEIIKASQKLRSLCLCKYVLTTCGARGMVLVGEKEPYIVEAFAKEVFDVTGAGDTTIAYLAMGVANKIDIKSAVEIANYAAGLQVAKVGTSSVYLSEVSKLLLRRKHGVIHKLINIETIESLRKDNKCKKIVFTNGCFDILHVGHIRYLQEAAKLGDILVIGLNSDVSVKKLKGNGRPINSEIERAEILCALECVDYVIIFDEDTPYELIKFIKPDVLVKGGDYKEDEVVGKDIVETSGGRLELIPFIDGKSTTNIINKIKE